MQSFFSTHIIKLFYHNYVLLWLCVETHKNPHKDLCEENNHENNVFIGILKTETMKHVPYLL